jgi:hypothetical protein
VRPTQRQSDAAPHPRALGVGGLDGEHVDHRRRVERVSARDASTTKVAFVRAKRAMTPGHELALPGRWRWNVRRGSRPTVLIDLVIDGHHVRVATLHRRG